MERVARAHEAVIESALAVATVVPLRLCTICRDRESVSRLLEDGAVRFGAALERVSGCLEWGVQAFAMRSAPSSAREAEVPPAEGRREETMDGITLPLLIAAAVGLLAWSLSRAAMSLRNSPQRKIKQRLSTDGVSTQGPAASLSITMEEHATVPEFLATKPAAAPDHLFFHQRDVRRRTAEGRGSEPQEQQRELAQGGEP